MSEVEKTAATPVEMPAVKAPVSKIDAAAEKAHAEAAAKVAAPEVVQVAPAPKLAAKITAAPAKTPVARKALKVTKAAAKTVTKAAKKTPVTKPVLAQTAETPAAAPKTNPVLKLKDTIMATVQNTDVTATAKQAFAEAQTRAKTAATTAYAKSTVLAAEATEFGKANVEAVVESGKIFFTGAQELLKDNIETGKTVIETVTEDAKKMAAVKSPTELMQLQGELARRNFDALVSYGSKRTEAWVKLYNQAFAPITNRVSVAAEKIKTAA
jgi:phasin family protein